MRARESSTPRRAAASATDSSIGSPFGIYPVDRMVYVSLARGRPDGKDLAQGMRPPWACHPEQRTRGGAGHTEPVPEDFVIARNPAEASTLPYPVSYTHLRAHETDSY